MARKAPAKRKAGPSPNGSESGGTALCYIRKSLVRGESDQHSPERQRRNQTAWCEMHAASAEFYVDAEGHRSGRSEEGRPDWQRLRQQLARPDVKYVLVETVSRSHRNLKELLEFVDEAQRHGVAYVSIQEGFDASTAMGRLALQILGAFAEAWSNMTSEKMQETIGMLRDDGKYWGFTPFGTMRGTNGKLVPDPGGVWWHPGDATTAPRWSEAEQPAEEGWQWRGFHDGLRELYERYGSDQFGFDFLATELNSLGYRYKGNSAKLHPWTREDVRRCLYMADTYAGHLIAGPAHPLEGNILTPDAWAPIIPLAAIEKARAVLERRGRGHRIPREGQHNAFELTPLLHCAHCQQPLEGQTTRWSKRIYRHRVKGTCPGTRGSGDADQIEADARDLLALFALPDEWGGILAAFARGQRRVAHDANQEDAARLVMLRRRRDRLKKLFEEEEIDWAEYRTKRTAYDTEIEELETRLGMSAVGDNAERIVTTLTRLRQISDAMARASPIHRKELFGLFFTRLELDLDKGALVFWPQEWCQDFF